MPRNILYGVVIVICLAAAVSVTVYKWRRQPVFDDADLRDVIERGQHIHVACGDADCGYVQAGYRAHSHDLDWPKTCPKCGQQTLWRAPLCHACGGRTPWAPGADGRVLCRRCGEWLNPTPGGERGPESP